MQDDYRRAAGFIEVALGEIGGFDCPSRTKILDLGCGTGQLVGALLQLGFEAYGCDLARDSSIDLSVTPERFSTISAMPYRLPFDENTFDAVVSTSVLEHARDKEVCFREIHRVLKPGGYSMHLYPGKWYLPFEPHIYVPLVNYFWPRCPKWWLGLWALLGVRNEFQRHKDWKAVLELNRKYCQDELSYWSSRQYRALSLRIFGNCSWPMQVYIDHSPGRFATICRKLPFKKFSGWLSRECRMSLLVHQKTGQPTHAADTLPHAAASSWRSRGSCAY